MKICIFGADGRTGVEVVNYAKSKGYDIVAFVYSEKALSFSKNDIKIIQGDVLDYSIVLKACIGVDVVVSVLGHISGSDPRMQTQGVINIVRAMKESNVRRIISLTGTGVRLPEDTPSCIDLILNYLVKIIDRDRIEDGIGYARVLQESGLDWTIVRVLKLSSSQTITKNYTLTTGGPVELLTSRKKVSRIIVDMIENKKYFYAMPVVSV
jgi:nucleoside-diphosphate-sugar epimerase